MNGIIKKKLNLLVHLARIDGVFHRSERDMIATLTGDASILHGEPVDSGNPVDEADQFDDKDEILFLALKLVQADNVVTDEELASCRKLAVKLGFRESVIDRFVHVQLPSISDFREEVKSWRLSVG